MPKVPGPEASPVDPQVPEPVRVYNMLMFTVMAWAVSVLALLLPFT